MEKLEIECAQRAARRMSMVLGMVVLILLSLAFAGAVWMVLSPDELGQMLLGGIWPEAISLSSGQIIALAVLVFMNVFGWAVVMWMGRNLFANLASGEIEKSARLARAIATGLWVLLFWQILAQALGSVVATWYFPPGQHALSIGVGFGQFGTVLGALVASFMAKALELGAQLWRDHQEIV